MHRGEWTPFTHMSMTNGNYASPPHLDSNDAGMGYVLFYLRRKYGKPCHYVSALTCVDCLQCFSFQLVAAHSTCHMMCLVCTVSFSCLTRSRHHDAQHAADRWLPKLL